MSRYDHRQIEEKWKKVWEDADIDRTDDDAPGERLFILDFFPYPSGQGLHVGHPLGYFATDIIARRRRMQGFNVLHPMGWDAFGLPAENYAIKTGVHPAESTAKNIQNFKRQFRLLGNSYDWSREITTCSPEYYRWTQWMFLYLYKRGLAYRKEAPVNWCPSCHTVLANEQVVDGACERCRTAVIQKNLAQWFFKVTEYADRLLDDLDGLDWPEKIKAMQRNWIGRSHGAEIVFTAKTTDGETVSLPVFTTRPDTLMGVTFVVLAPEHPLVERLTSDAQRDVVAAYREAARGKSELERTSTDEKTGVPLGSTVTHPLTGMEVPLWIGDYVLATYGTGAVMGVPAHDERDFAFAGKYGVPVITVIEPQGAGNGEKVAEGAYTGAGVLVNSGAFDGLASDDAKARITEALAKKNVGGPRTTYHIRDWLISRQRYWGAPIPIIHCENCGEQPVPEEQLPVELPDDVDFMPTGESPLAKSVTFHDVRCPECGGTARRESDTMDTFVDSSWYFLRFPSPHADTAPFDRAAVERWLPVDLYVGGAEHAVLHLLYARFFTKALADGGLLGFQEPFTALKNPGMILGENSEKMSKSRGNVVNPDEVVEEYGADALRLYEMFMGEFADTKPWSTNGIVGVRRFLDRLWTIVHDTVHQERDQVADELARSLHRTIKKVGEDVDACKFNTAVSSMMILLNDWYRLGGGDKHLAGAFVRILAPFAPHVAEELWHVLGNESSVLRQAWPEYDETMLASEQVTVVVQVNGKVKDRITVGVGLPGEELKALAAAAEKVRPLLEGKVIRNAVVVPDKLVNFVLG